MIFANSTEVHLKGSKLDIMTELTHVLESAKESLGEESYKTVLQVASYTKEERSRKVSELFAETLAEILFGKKPAPQPEQPQPEPEPAPEPEQAAEPEPAKYGRGDEVRFLRHGVPVYGVIIGNAVEPDERYILTDSIDYPLVEKTCDLELTGQHFDLPLKKV